MPTSPVVTRTTALLLRTHRFDASTHQMATSRDGGYKFVKMTTARSTGAAS